MPAVLRRMLGYASRYSWYLIAAAAVLLAVGMGVAWQSMRWLEANPQQVSAFLSQRAGHPVVFDGLRGQWTRRGPLLGLQNLRVGQPGHAVEVGDAQLLIAQYTGLLPGRSLTVLRIRGLDLTLDRSADGRWQVRGLPGEDAGGDPLDALQSLGELQVVGARLAVHAPDLNIDAVLSRVDVRLQVDGARVRAGARARLNADGAPVDAVIDFDRRSGDGRAWFNARRTDLAEWSALLNVAGVNVQGGSGRSQVWLQLHDNRVQRVTADAQLAQVRLASTEAGQGEQVLEFARFNTLASWQQQDGNWRVDAPRLRIEPVKGQPQQLDGLLLAGGQVMALQAKQVDAAPLLALLALSSQAPAELRNWLRSAKPDVRLQDVRIHALKDGPVQASGRILGARFDPVGDAPGLRGLNADVQGDADGLRVSLDSDAQVEFDWPRGFGVVHPVRLHGDLMAWREGAGWQVSTSSLRVQGKDFGMRARGGLLWHGDGRLPRIDIAANVDRARVPVAKGFWVRNQMHQDLLDWLNMALVDGTVEDGYALVSGDLSDWPFNNRNGRFEAGGRIRNATLRFQPDWPAATGVDGRLSFIADGFSVEGDKGNLAGIHIGRFKAGIARFEHSGLIVEAEGRGDAANMLALLRQSPLEKEHGEVFKQLAAKGPASLTFRMDLPTHIPGAHPDINGTVHLHGVQLAEREWDLAFDNVQGSAKYDDGGFVAEQLQVRHKGEAGRLSLRVGDYVKTAGQVFEAELEARLDAHELLARAPDLDWLKPHLRGVSPWTIAVALPQTRPGQALSAPSRLQLRSNLLGTSLNLPAPLQKPANQALATTIDAQLPLGQGDIHVGFDHRLALRVRESNGQTGVRVALGQRHVAEAPPRSGIVIAGRTPQLDAMDWAGLLQGDSASAGKDMPLRELDVQAGQLNLLGNQFANTRVRLQPASAGSRLHVDGSGIAGEVVIPESNSASVRGRLQRLHIATPAPSAGHAPAAANQAAAQINPASIPPLEINIDDLRVGQARLGQIALRTRPVAGGMHITQLQARSAGHRIDVNGQWLGSGSNAQTRMAVEVGSNDFGGLLSALGLGGQLQGGRGTLTGDLRWAGGPAQFSAAGLTGNAHVDVKDGVLVEIEPGAGRFIGLLGVAQLPRRLSLDFRDFTDKGLGFETLTGDVRLASGLARSDNLRINSPAAEIQIRGSANMVAQTYDQTIHVTPNTGNLLPVAGALAAGPVGAAIGAAAGAVLRRPLSSVGAKTYRITGPWSDPQVSTMDSSQRAQR